jgi:hypothetical protein
MTLFLASHEKMCQISYKIPLFWMATMVDRKMSQTLGTYGLDLPNCIQSSEICEFSENDPSRLCICLNKLFEYMIQNYKRGFIKCKIFTKTCTKSETSSHTCQRQLRHIHPSTFTNKQYKLG